jgi:P-type Ca2+ transporter type 2C
MEATHNVVKNGSDESAYKLPSEDVLRLMGTRTGGLTAAEVIEKQQSYGKNVLAEKNKKPLILVFAANFISLMAILLWIGGAIAIVADMVQLGIAIWLVNIINGIFSFWQEFRAGKATEALKNMLPSFARVIREGQELQILVEDLVPGDIVLLQEGDKISADARLIDSSDLQVNQSTLTGESNPVRKTHEPILRGGLSRSEIPNLIFTGTSVASGNAKAVVITIGMQTEFGKIANLTQEVKDVLSPLQKELDKLTKQVSLMAIIAGVLFFLASVFIVKDPVAKSFIFSLGMIVAFIPEGLLPTVTLSLAMAVQRMVKEHALVKRLSAVETLGCTTVICSDKTGTLTQNEMTVISLWLPAGELDVSGLGYAPVGKITSGGKETSAAGNEDLKLLLTAAALCSNARLVPPEDPTGRFTVLGDPTEACLGVVAQKAGLDITTLSSETPRIRELPFDSRRKRMSTIHQLNKPSGSIRAAYVKGAPKEVLELCTGISIHGAREDITQSQCDEIMQANDKYARNGLRVLAVACRYITRETGLPSALSAYTPELVEQELIFLGLVVMADPPRPEVAEAVELCRKASIRIIMITGDYGLTAESIAKRIGIVKSEHPLIVTGTELEKMSDSELQAALKQEIIFARVAPEQKYKIVSTLQEMGQIVAVTGDGVNDAPALKKADIGIAMGISGTDVAKEAADMILTDDNFASIVRAIEEGRAVYSNIRKFMLYILNSNMPEAVPSAAFLFSRGAIPLPLTVMQILSVDLGTDMLPALGLGTELPEEGVMEQPPRSQKDPLLNKRIFIKAFLWYGLLESAISMGAYFYVQWQNGWPNAPLAGSGIAYSHATTMTLAAIVFCQIAMVMNCRTSTSSVFKIGLFKNKHVMFGIVCELAILCALVYLPFLHGIFNTTPLDLKDWIFLILIPIPLLLIEEARKAVSRKLNRKKNKEVLK